VSLRAVITIDLSHYFIIFCNIINIILIIFCCALFDFNYMDFVGTMIC
jgi:hypothetical protein